MFVRNRIDEIRAHPAIVRYVSSAEVQLANGHIIDRPISKLYPLESSTPPTTAKPESERRQFTRLAAIRARERLPSPSLY